MAEVDGLNRVRVAGAVAGLMLVTVEADSDPGADGLMRVNGPTTGGALMVLRSSTAPGMMRVIRHS